MENNNKKCKLANYHRIIYLSNAEERLCALEARFEVESRQLHGIRLDENGHQRQALFERDELLAMDRSVVERALNQVADSLARNRRSSPSPSLLPPPPSLGGRQARRSYGGACLGSAVHCQPSSPSHGRVRAAAPLVPIFRRFSFPLFFSFFATLS